MKTMLLPSENPIPLKDSKIVGLSTSGAGIAFATSSLEGMVRSPACCGSRETGVSQSEKVMTDSSSKRLSCCISRPTSGVPMTIASLILSSSNVYVTSDSISQNGLANIASFPPSCREGAFRAASISSDDVSTILTDEGSPHDSSFPS